MDETKSQTSMDDLPGQSFEEFQSALCDHINRVLIYAGESYALDEICKEISFLHNRIQALERKANETAHSKDH